MVEKFRIDFLRQGPAGAVLDYHSAAYDKTTSRSWRIGSFPAGSVLVANAPWLSRHLSQSSLGGLNRGSIQLFSGDGIFCGNKEQMTNCELEQRLSKYHFYHCIKLNSDVTTKGIPEFMAQQSLVLRELDRLQLEGKRVLDIGCRDGLFSLHAEARGASEVVGIDNDLSQGTQEVVLPYLHSKVRLCGLNLYDLRPETFGTFDGIIFSGVLYHLRFPVWGLKLVRDVLRPEGWLLLETAIYREHEDLPLLYCPIDDESPYEPTSVTFFNIKGLTDTLSSLGIAVQRVEFLGVDPRIDRAAVTCQFIPEIIHPTQRQYWEESHDLHSTLSREEQFQLVREKSERLYRTPKLKRPQSIESGPK